MTKPTRPTFEGAFPNITLWVKDFGMVEIGYDPNTDSFIRAIDEGGMVWSGKSRYETLDDALRDLEAGLGQILVGRALGTRAVSQTKSHPRRRRARRKPRRDDGRDRLKTR